MNLPNLDKMYPQEEEKVFSTCSNCKEDIMEGYDFVFNYNHDFCNIECFLEQAYKEGDITRGVAGE